MKFDSIDTLRTTQAYASKFKQVFNGLGEGELGDFWFYDGVKVDNKVGSTLVFGTVMPALLKQLKAECRTSASGKCFREGPVLKMSVVKGAVSEAKLIPVFKAAKGKFTLVKGDLQPGDQHGGGTDAASKCKAIVDRARDRFDAKEMVLTQDKLKEFKARMPAILKAEKAADVAETTKLVSAFLKDLNAYVADVEEDPDTGKKLKAMALKRWDVSLERYTKAKPSLNNDMIAAQKTLWDNAEKLKKAETWDGVMDTLTRADTLLATMLKTLKKEHDDSSVAREKAMARRDSAWTRFEQAKPKLSNDDVQALEKLWTAADRMRDAGDWPGLMKAATQCDTRLVELLKAALAREKDAKTTAKGKVKGAELTKGGKAVVQKIVLQAQAVETKRKAMDPDRAKMQGVLDELQLLRRALTKAQADGDGAKVTDTENRMKPLTTELAEIRKRLETSGKALAKERTALEKLEAQLTKMKEDRDPAAVKALAAAKGSIKDLEALLENVPFDVAQQAIRESVKEMAEATKWHEEQIKREAKAEDDNAQIKPHIAGRHGAQTGVGRQARRAGTAEKVRPDQRGNQGGAPQNIEWNKVKITYTEEDGKRVVKNRDKVAQALIDSMSNQGGADTASIWANPVVEKEAVDTALAHAAKLKKYRYYVSGKGRNAHENDFKDLVIVLGAPKKSKGWGYGVENSGGNVSKDDANRILKAFEAGEMTEAAMLKQMNVKLVERDGGATMLPFCKLILKRSSITGDWTVLTGYPDSKSTAVGWTPHSNMLAKVKMREAHNGQITEVTANALP